MLIPDDIALHNQDAKRINFQIHFLMNEKNGANYEDEKAVIIFVFQPFQSMSRYLLSCAVKNLKELDIHFYRLVVHSLSSNTN